jgi:hypothetical protein
MNIHRRHFFFIGNVTIIDLNADWSTLNINASTNQNASLSSRKRARLRQYIYIGAQLGLCQQQQLSLCRIVQLSFVFILVRSLVIIKTFFYQLFSTSAHSISYKPRAIVKTIWPKSKIIRRR